jgi:hypothetical protein
MRTNRSTVGVVGLLISLGLFACSSDDDDKDKGDGDADVGYVLPSGKEAIASYDKNDDGVLTKSEVPPGMADMFDEIDTNGDGKLTDTEIDKARNKRSSTSTDAVSGSTDSKNIDAGTKSKDAGSGKSNSAGGSGGSGGGKSTSPSTSSTPANPGKAVDAGICVRGTAKPTRIAPKIVLLLDGSSSMSSAYGDATRWSAMRTAVVDPSSGVVKTTEGIIEYGLAIFAGEYLLGGGSCPFPGDVIAPKLNNYAAIDGAFPLTSPGMYTPTGDALGKICDSLPGAGDIKPQYVILATDGQPNSCGGLGGGRDENMGFTTNYEPVIESATACCDKGVKVYVISLASGGAEYEQHLQEVANIGACTSGTAKVYNPKDPGQLANDLKGLVTTAATCDVVLDGTVVKGKECQGSVVTLNGKTIGCNDANGWALASDKVIRLQGQACSEFKGNPDSKVEATFPCESYTPDDAGTGGSGGSGGNTGGGGSGGDNNKGEGGNTGGGGSGGDNNKGEGGSSGGGGDNNGEGGSSGGGGTIIY